MSGPTVEVIDPHDDAVLARWHAVRAAAVRHGRPFALQQSAAALAASVRTPSRYVRRHLLAASSPASAGPGGEVVGVAELRVSTSDNLHLAGVQVDVHPDHRRRGVGTALWEAVDALRHAEGRTTVAGEAHGPLGSAGPGAAVAFAASLGFTVVHTQEHLAMRLPADPVTADLLTRDVPGYEVVTWTDRCPDEHRAAYLAMRNQMNADVPTGDLAVEPVVLDEERLADSEERLARSYVTVVAAARRVADGAMGGYSLVFLDRSDDVALQDDTLVMPEHRGRGLGMQLKQATRAVVEAEHPGRTVLHTWTDPTNAAMYRTNIAFGFAPVELEHQVQRVD
jgi:GNAT superfamily N-acetyltransferase